MNRLKSVKTKREKLLIIFLTIVFCVLLFRFFNKFWEARKHQDLHQIENLKMELQNE